MYAYIVRRLLLIPLTLFGIMVVNFAFVQIAPGGPVEQVLARVQGQAAAATARLGSSAESTVANSQSGSSRYRGARGLDPQFVAQLRHQFGFDQPPLTRFWRMMGAYARFDFGKSFFQDETVVQLVLDRLPVSMSLGIWSTLIIYLVSIPLGIRKAVQDGSRFDFWTSWVVVVGNAVPGYLFAILLIVIFAGGRYFSWFPLQGLVGEAWHGLPWYRQVGDYFWHLVLPTLSLVIGGFAGLTMLTKNCFMDEIGKQYVVTARAKGLSERQVLYRHVFRNAMLLVISGFPQALVGVLFTGALLIEYIFSLNGIGLLGYEAVINRDYPVVFGTLYAFGLIGLVLNLISDLTYHMIDPRIDFDSR